MHYIDDFLNKITMYKLVLYGLFILVLVGSGFGFLGFISYSVLSIVYSLLVLGGVCYFANTVFAKLFKVQTNSESYLITAFILTLTLKPISSISDLKIHILVGGIAMVSKYIFAINKKHIFNPAAIALLLITIFGFGLDYWWIGSKALLVPTAILGFLVLRKIQRFQMFSIFSVISLATISIVYIYKGLGLFDSISTSILSAPLIFFGTIMLTEPLTAPPKKKLQFIYAVVVGVIYGLDFHFGIVYNSPELALVIGNIFSFIVSPKDKLVLKLISKKAINENGDVDEFIFEADKKLTYKPGQYLEWTLGHKNVDMRGNRRYFTLASSPTEKEIKIGIKFYDKASSFKQNLGEMKPGDRLMAGQLSGEFTLPEDKNKKLVFIAGGIGVTPFRSISKYLIDNKESRDAVLFFSNKTPKDIVYRDIFEEAERVSGMKTVYVVNDLAGESNVNYKVGFVSEEMIKAEVPDYKERMFYISGPRGMIVAFENTLAKIGIPKSNIKTDFFPGFV